MATLRAKFRYFGGLGMVSQMDEASKNASPKDCSRCLFTVSFYVGGTNLETRNWKLETRNLRCFAGV